MIQQSDTNQRAATRRAGQKMLVLLASALAMLIAGGWTATASAAPVLQVDHVANHQIPRVSGDIELEATVRNIGPDATSGEYAIEYELPEGLSPLTMTGGVGWTCDLPTLRCVRSTAIASNASATKVTLYADIDEGYESEAVVTDVRVSGGGSVDGSSEQRLLTAPEFGIKSVETAVQDSAGVEYTEAGGHPFSARADFWMNSFRSERGYVDVIENVKDVITELPPGFVGNPNAADECEFTSQMRLGQCKLSSVVGYVFVSFAFGDRFNPFYNGSTVGIYRLKAKPGYAATFAFEIQGTAVMLNVSVRSESDHGVTVTAVGAPQRPQTGGVRVVFCGQGTHVELGVYPPSTMTFDCVDRESPYAYKTPLLINPADCSVEAPTTVMHANSWQDPSDWKSASFESPQVTDCEDLSFGPEVDIAPTTSSPDTPSGLDVAMTFPTEDNAAGLAPPPLKKAVVTMPEGMSINPAAAGGLAACSDAQLNLKNRDPVDCPEASKIGTVTATTPVLDETLSGGVYIRSQNSDDPESGEMFRLALVLENKERGLSIRLPGQVRVNKDTGRIETTFDNNPQLPVESLNLKLKQGPRAPLATPATCGEKSIDTVLTSWGGQTIERTSKFDVACAAGLGGFAPRFDAGAVNPVAGTFSPFAVQIAKRDGDSAIDGVSLKVPTGLLAKVAGNLGTQVGSVRVLAGPGSQPYVLPGTVTLEGAYGDAPYSLRVVVPAKAGPFDLGDVTVRQKVYVDPVTAEVTVVSDPVPTIVKGVPARIQRLEVNVDKPGFMVNPTSCAKKQVTGTLKALGGQTAEVQSRFQVGECASLPFKPRLTMSLTGRKQVTTGKHPGVRARVNQTGLGEAGIEKAVVRLPKSLALDPNNAQALCEFEDGTKPDLENHCPAGSIVGKARATTPLLERPLSGNVYFVKNVRRDATTGNLIRTLPMIVVALRGEIAINLKGESSTTKGGKLVNTFDNVPDAPITRFDLNIAGGKNGILAVTRTRRARINLCAGRHIAEADMDGQNGKRYDRDVQMKTPCTKRQTKAAKRQAKRAAAKARH